MNWFPLLIGIFVGFVIGASLQTMWDAENAGDAYALGYRMGKTGQRPLDWMT